MNQCALAWAYCSNLRSQGVRNGYCESMRWLVLAWTTVFEVAQPTLTRTTAFGHVGSARDEDRPLRKSHRPTRRKQGTPRHQLVKQSYHSMRHQVLHYCSKSRIMCSTPHLHKQFSQLQTQGLNHRYAALRNPACLACTT